MSRISKPVGRPAKGPVPKVRAAEAGVASRRDEPGTLLIEDGATMLWLRFAPEPRGDDESVVDEE